MKTGLITGLIKTKSLTASLRHGALLEPEIEHGTFRAAQAAVREGSNRGVHGLVDHSRISDLFANGGPSEVATSLEVLEGATRRWMADPAARRGAGERALAYVRERSDPGAVGDRLAAIVERDAAARAAARPRAPKGR